VGVNGELDWEPPILEQNECRIYRDGQPDPVVKLRAVAEAARARCRDAVPEWAPELRAALAALEEP
jgi:hypothetical protein